MHSTDVQTLKRLRPIAEVVESYGIPLRRIGRSLIGRCPFPEALARLEGRPAILARRRSAPPRHRRQRLGPDERSCLVAAVDFYYNRLLSEDQALEYLTRRGISRETIDRYCLGFARGNGLAEYLRWRRLPVGAARRAGLIRPPGAEVFAGRIIYPELREGQVVWMTGRSLNAECEPRYLSLPGRKPLLGWEAARQASWIILTEGVFDFLVLRQWGYPAVALTGTAIGPKLLRAMRSFQTVYLALGQRRRRPAGHGESRRVPRCPGSPAPAWWRKGRRRAGRPAGRPAAARSRVSAMARAGRVTRRSQ